MDGHKDSLAIAVLPMTANPTRLERRPNDLPKLERLLDRTARDLERATSRRRGSSISLDLPLRAFFATGATKRGLARVLTSRRRPVAANA